MTDKIEHYLTEYLELKMSHFRELEIVKFKVPFNYRYNRFNYTDDQMRGCLAMIYFRHFAQRMEKMPQIPRVKRTTIYPLVDFFHEARIKSAEDYGIFEMRVSDSFVEIMEDIPHDDVWQIFKKLFFIQNGISGKDYYLKDFKEMPVEFNKPELLEEFRLRLGKVVISSKSKQDTKFEVELASHLSFDFKDFLIRKGASNTRECNEQHPLTIKPTLITEILNVNEYEKGRVPGKWVQKIPKEIYHINRTFLTHYIQSNIEGKEEIISEVFAKREFGENWLPDSLTSDEKKRIALCPSYRPIKMENFGRANSYSFILKVPEYRNKGEGSVETFHFLPFFDKEFVWTRDFANEEDDKVDFERIEVIDFNYSLARVKGRTKKMSLREVKDMFVAIDDNVRTLKVKDIPGILKRIPNFNLDFTNKQLRIIAKDTKKILVVGWSGTGKTTCSVLRMIAVELLFIAAVKVKNGIRQVTADDIKPTGIRSVFITANEILCDQLRGFYHKVIGLVRTKLSNSGKQSTIDDLAQITHGLLKNFDLDHFRENELSFSKGGENEEIIDNKVLAKLKQGSIEELLSFLETHDFQKRAKNTAKSFQEMDKEDFPLFITMLDYLKMENASNDKDFLQQERFILRDSSEHIFEELPDSRMLRPMKKFASTELPLEAEVATASSLRKSNFKSYYIDINTFRDRFYPYLMSALKEAMQVRSRQLKIYTPQVVFFALRNRFVLKHTDPLVEMPHYLFIRDMYEAMRTLSYGYDMTDLFYWCYFIVKKRWWNRFPFVYVDEVQDLTDDMIEHILRMSMNALGRVVFFGHNAQNIARGTSLKFFRLAERLVSSRDGFSADFVQLSKNYRSHQEIIDLGNSVFKLLLLVSMGDLEIMPNEESVSRGPKPLVVELGIEMPSFKELLDNYLGTNFVVLVRDEEARKALPDELKDKFCLTIYESKGLEFDDVVIFDYFDRSDSYRSWNFITKVDIEERVVDSAEHDAIMENLKHGRIKDDRIFLKSSKVDDLNYNVKEFLLGRAMDKDDLLFYNEVNDELKQLYVAITRAKNRVVIYDRTKEQKHSSHPRRLMDEFWSKLSLVQFVDKKTSMIEPSSELGQYLSNFKIFGKKSEESVRLEWMEKAVTFYRNRQFHFAKSCFESIGNEYGVNLMQAYQELDVAEATERSDVIENKESYKSLFLLLGPKFNALKKHDIAADCFMRANSYGEAFDAAQRGSHIERMALSKLSTGEFKEASQLYRSISNMDMESQCLLEHIGGSIQKFEDALKEIIDRESGESESFSVYESIFYAYASQLHTLLQNLENTKKVDDRRGYEVKKDALSIYKLLSSIFSADKDERYSIELKTEELQIITKLAKSFSYCSPSYQQTLKDNIGADLNEVSEHTWKKFFENITTNRQFIEELYQFGLRSLAKSLRTILPIDQARRHRFVTQVDSMQSVIKTMPEDERTSEIVQQLIEIFETYKNELHVESKLWRYLASFGYGKYIVGIAKDDYLSAILGYSDIISLSRGKVIDDNQISSTDQYQFEALITKIVTQDLVKLSSKELKRDSKTLETSSPLLSKLFLLLESFTNKRSESQLLLEVLEETSIILNKRKGRVDEYLVGGVCASIVLQLLLPNMPSIFPKSLKKACQSILTTDSKIILSKITSKLSAFRPKGESPQVPNPQNMIFLKGFCLGANVRIIPEASETLKFSYCDRAIVHRHSPLKSSIENSSHTFIFDLEGEYSVCSLTQVMDLLLVSLGGTSTKERNNKEQAENIILEVASKGFVPLENEGYLESLNASFMKYPLFQKNLDAIEDMKKKIKRHIPKNDKNIKQLQKDKKDNQKKLKLLTTVDTFPQSFALEEEINLHFSSNPYFTTKSRPVKEKHTIFRMMHLFKKRSILQCTNRSIHDYFCLCLNAGNLGYFHMLKSAMTHKKLKTFDDQIFLLIDSELSLLSGNTQEFYDEALEYLNKYSIKIGTERALHYILKILQVSLLAIGKNEACIDNLDFIKSYPTFCDLKNIILNPLSDPKLSHLLIAYKKVMANVTQFYFKEAEEIVSKINFLIVSNKLGPQNVFVADPEIVKNYDYQEKNIKSIWKDSHANTNFELYNKEVSSLLISRAKLEFARQVMRKHYLVFKTLQKKDKEEKKKIESMNALLIDYDFLTLFRGDQSQIMAGELFALPYFPELFVLYDVSSSREFLSPPHSLNEKYADIIDLLTDLTEKTKDSLISMSTVDNSGKLISILQAFKSKLHRRYK